MSIGEATIWLELDKTRQRLRTWEERGGPQYLVERTGWKRFLTLTRMLHDAKAEYDVHFDYVPFVLGTDRFDVEHAAVILCAGAKLKATVTWVIQ